MNEDTGEFKVFGYCEMWPSKGWQWQLLCTRDFEVEAIEMAKLYIERGSLMQEKVLECRIEYIEIVTRKIKVTAEIKFKVEKS